MPAKALSRQALNVKNLPIIHSYNELRDAVKAALLRGHERMEMERIRTYWDVGRLIDKFVLNADGRAEFGKRVVLRLARDLEMNRTALYQAVRFAKAYPIVHLGGQLTWSHYRALAFVAGKKERKALEEQVRRFGWTKEDLEAHIKSARLEQRDASEHRQKVLPLLDVPELGNLYTYRVVGAEKIKPAEDSLWLDLGFTNYKKLVPEMVVNQSTSNKTVIARSPTGATKQSQSGAEIASPPSAPRVLPVEAASCSPCGAGARNDEQWVSTNTLKVGDILKVTQREDRTFHFQKLTESGGEKGVRSSEKASLLYTYKAFVERVVDGDTLRVQIDLGFGHRIRQYLRLRGIDSPEIHTPRGRRAKGFVERKLKKMPFIIFRSHRAEKYDRYLADVFYGEDRYLNQDLLNAAFADRA